VVRSGAAAGWVWGRADWCGGGIVVLSPRARVEHQRPNEILGAMNAN